MTSLTSTLTVKLIDDVSKPARSVAQALKQAEKNARDVAKAMSGSGATDKFVRDLSKLKLSAKDIETVAAAWKDYSRSAGLAAKASDWTRTQAQGVRAWERQTIDALRKVKREQIAFNREMGKGGGVSPMMLAMSQGAMANKRMITGMSAAGARRVAKAPAGAIGAAELAAGGGLLGGYSLGGVALAYGGYSAGRHVVEGGVERQHARVAALNAGMTRAELRQAETASVAATRYAPTMSASEIMELVQDIRSSVQDQGDLYRLLPQVARAASILKGMGAENANIGDIVKAGDTLGLLTDPKRFEGFLSGQVKAMAVLGRTVSTEQVYEAAKYSKSAGATMSDRFLNLTLPGLIQELKGSSAGDTLSMLTKTLRGGLQSRHLSVMRLNELGLLEYPSKIVRTKTGDIKGYSGNLKGDSLLASDPDKWFQTIFKEAAEKRGVTNNADMVKLLSEILPSRAANVARIMMQQEQSLKTQASLFQSTPDMQGMIANQRADPKAAWTEVKAAAADLGAAALEAVPAAAAMKTLADGIRTLSGAISAPGKWIDETKAKWGRVGDMAASGATSWWGKYMGAPGAFAAQPVQKAPAFAQMEGAAPHVDATQIDAAKTSADTAKAAIEALNVSVAPQVGTGSLEQALSLAQSVNAELARIGSNAANAATQVGRINAAAASVKLPTFAQINRGSFSAAGDPAGK